uniref:GH16 domain-containing protein n=1 Tax=Acrobeloides nanus TaxID=290746 RepID=A0A914EJP8_9BILA
MSQCCQLCQQKLGCRAYTWDSFNGGTCWLKSATQPLSKVDPHGSGYSITGILSPSANETYTLNQTYAAPNFFDTWHFDDWGLTNVTKDVDKQTAQNLGMIGYQNGKVYIGLDHKNVYNTTGRPSIMLQTNYLYNSGLFVLSLDHMPTGPGTWPAFWTAGPNWPNHGEIDILEGVSNMTSNLVTIHVGDNCYEKANDSMFFTGTWNGEKTKPNQTIIFDIALCGSWVSQFIPGGEAACEEMVNKHPELYTEAYWLINYVKVFCKPNEPCGFYEPKCEFQC